MGNNSVVFRKKIKRFSEIRAAIGIAALVLIFTAPVLALADSASTATAWTQTECEDPKVGGSWELVTAGTSNYDCYTKQVPSPIMISIGTLSGSATITQYVKAFYDYMVVGASVLAVIFIMIGGFQILYSAGGEAVGEGRKKITNAILGLVLIFCSYILLQTVNPALVNLQAPRIKLIKANYLTMLQSSNGIGIGDACYTIKDKDACAQACVKAGLTSASCQCVVMDQGTIATISNVMAAAGIGGVAIEVAGGLEVARQVINKVGSTLLSYVPSILQIAASSWKILAGAYVAYKITDTSTPPGDEGVCLPMAANSIPVGGTCLTDSNCIAPAKCVMIPSTDPQFGMCQTGLEGTACDSSAQAFMVNGSPSACSASNLSCCVVSSGLGYCQKNCSALPIGASCKSNDQCTSHLCAPSGTGDTVCSSGGSNSSCMVDDGTQCNVGTFCPTPYYNLGVGGDLTKPYKVCTNYRGSGDSCCNSQECGTGHFCSGAKPDSGNQCIISAAGSVVCPGCGTCF
jgi:hypothetical protein